MSDLPLEFIDLMNEKRKLENSINEAIRVFESHFGNVIQIENIHKMPINTIGGTSTTRVIVTLRIE